MPNEPLPINSSSAVGNVMKAVGLIVARKLRTVRRALANGAFTFSWLINL